LRLSLGRLLDMNGMTKEEIIKLLKSRGIPVGGWENTDPKTVKSPIVEKQKENLKKLADLLEAQIAKDVETIADLHISLQQIKGRKDAK